MKLLGVLIGLALPVLACVSCTTGAGDGGVYGSVHLEECDVVDDDFDLDVSFFAASYFEDSLTIKLQRSGADQYRSDGIIIVVRSVDYVAAHLGEPLDVVVTPTLDGFLATGPDLESGDEKGYPITTYGSHARSTLYLNRLCPENTLGFADGEGTITFDSIYQPDKSKRILGSFELRFLDPRTWEDGAVSSHAELMGEFDFNYARGAPAQTFP